MLAFADYTHLFFMSLFWWLPKEWGTQNKIYRVAASSSHWDGVMSVSRTSAGEVDNGYWRWQQQGYDIAGKLDIVYGTGWEKGWAGGYKVGVKQFERFKENVQIEYKKWGCKEHGLD